MKYIAVPDFSYQEIVKQTKQIKAIRQELIKELAAIEAEGAQNANTTL